MKCPNCGAEFSSAKFCEFCGAQLPSEMVKEQELLNKQGCPKCGSTNVSFHRENQGEIQGKNKKVVVHETVGLCKDCGYTWTTTETPKKRKTWLWVLGWIFIFPLPLTLILLKKKEMKPALKYGIIAAAWVLYLIFVFAGRSSDKPTVDQPDVPTTVSILQEDTTLNDSEETEETAAVTEKKPEETKPTETKSAETKPAETKPAETKPTETKPAETKPTETKKSDPALVNGMRKDFKDAMDSYERFMDEYVAFMKKYSENPSDFTLLSEYAEYMRKYADMCAKFDKWESEDMNDAEIAYYIDVQARVNKKLLEVS